MRVAVTPLLVLLFFLLLPALSYAADVQPAAGCHTITSAEQAALKEAGATIPSNGQFCDADKTLLYGSCPESPYPYLESKKVRSDVDVAHFNADYACRLYKFFKAADGAGMTIKITSGFRSIAKQAALYANRGATPVAPPGRSKHNYGIAADLTFDGVWPNYSANSPMNTPLCIQRLPSCKWAHDNASSYGLRWPMVVEPWHIEPGTAVKGGEQITNDPNYWSTDAGTTYSGGPLAPVSTAPYYCIISVAPIVTIPSQMPPGPGCYNQMAPQQTPYSSSPLMQPAPTTVPTQTQTQNQNSTGNQPHICDPKFSCTGSVTYYQTSSCTSQVYQVCQYGCSTSGTSCATSTSTSATSTHNSTGTSINIGTSTDNSNTDTNDNSNGTGPSVSDLLNNMVNAVSFTSADIGTSTSLAFRLNPDTGDVETLDASERPTSTVAAGTITSVQPLPGQQTFTSGDLGNTYDGQYGSQQTSTFQSVLNGLQSALLWALNVLKGFRV